MHIVIRGILGSSELNRRKEEQKAMQFLFIVFTVYKTFTSYKFIVAVDNNS